MAPNNKGGGGFCYWPTAARDRVRGAGGPDVAPAVLVPAAAFFGAIVADGEETPNKRDGSKEKSLHYLARQMSSVETRTPKMSHTPFRFGEGRGVIQDPTQKILEHTWFLPRFRPHECVKPYVLPICIFIWINTRGYTGLHPLWIAGQR